MKMGTLYLKRVSKIWHDHYRPIVTFFLVVAIAIITPLAQFSNVLSATYTWTQTDWSGGTTANTALHPGNQTGWTEYSLNDGGAFASSTLELLFTASSTTHTTDSDFESGATSSTMIVGTGSSSTITLITDPTVAPFVEWEKTVERNNIYHNLGIDSNDNIYVITTSGGIRKYDTDGNYTSFASLQGSNIAQLVIDPTNDNVIAGAGSTLTVYDPSGTSLYSTSSATNGITVDNQGYIYTMGSTAAVTKRNPDLSEIFTTATFGNTASYINGAGVAANGNIMVTAPLQNSPTSQYAWLKMFASSTGAEIWEDKTTLVTQYGATVVYGRSVYYDQDSDSFIARGDHNSTGGWIAKFSSSGTRQWYQRNTNPEPDGNNVTRVDASGKILSAGDWNNAGIIDSRNPSTGAVLWSKALSSFSFGSVRGMDIDSQNNIYVSGSKYVSPYSYGVIIKLAPSYSPTGTWTSPSVDTGGSSRFSNLSWTATTSTNTSVKFQIATNNDNSTWNFIGPDGTSGTYYATSGDAIYSGHNGDRYAKYRAYLETTSSGETPELVDVTLEYGTYASSSVIRSTAYNTNDSFNTLASISWSENLPTNTDVQFQIRTAPDNTGVPGTWTEWYGPTGTSSYFTDYTGGEALASEISDSTNDQWVQYQVILSTTDNLDTPTISSITLTYVVNGTPVVENVQNDGGGSLDQDEDGVIRLQYDTLDIDNTAVESYFFYDIGVTLADEGGSLDVLDSTDIVVNNSESLPSAGTIMIDREVIEYTSNATGTATLSGITRGQWPGNPSWSSTVAEHINGATVYLLASTITGEGSKTVSTATSTFSSTITPASDVSGVYLTDATVAIAINDGELANMVGVGTSSSFTLDTKAPTGGYLLYNSITNQLTISTNDDSPVAMKLSNNSDLSADGVNPDSGEWIAYGTDGNIDGYGDTPLTASVTKSWTGTGNDVETIYAQFKDSKGNTSSIISVNTPRKPSSFIFRDISNVDIDDYKLFVAWGVIPTPSPGFQHYKVFRSEDGNAFALFDTITDINENFFIDSGLSSTTEYAYKIYSEDTDGNVSDYSATVTDTPNGQGGSDLTPPTITSVSATNLVPQGVEISWTTDELSNSTVGYSVDTNYATETGSPTMTTDHSVILSSLTPNTTYNFRVKSEDPNSNASNWYSGYQFTTPPGPAISNVTVTETTSATAKIQWITDTPADSYVIYSTNANMASSTQVGSGTLTTNHSVSLSNLTEGEIYYYYVQSTDGTANLSTDSNAGNYYAFVTTIDNDGPVISNLTVATINNSSATIIWQTDENSTSQVFYGTTPSFGNSTTLDSTLSIQHSVTLTGLDKETNYYFKVSSTDAGGNNSEDDNGGSGHMFVTTDDPGLTLVIDDTQYITDTSAPTSNAILVSNISPTSAQITWSTNEPGNSLISYGVSTAYGYLDGNISESTTSHVVTLKRLTPATRYHFKTISQDGSGNIGSSGDNTFTTLNEDGTVVEGAEPPSTENNMESEELPGIEESVTIDEEGILDAISRASEAFITEIIKVLPKNPNLNKIPEDAFIETVAEIAPKVVSSPEIASQDLTVEVGPTWAIFTWVTSKKANGLVGISPEEGFTGEYKRKEGDPETLTTSHRVVVEGLEPQTTYHYSVQSKGQLGDWAKSPDATFVTTSLLSDIEGLRFDSIGTTEVVLSWDTSLPTRTSIEVTDTATGEAFIYDDPSYLKEHRVVLSDLNLSTNYVMQIVAEDEVGNISSSSVLPFTTQASLVPAVIDQVRTTTALVPGQIERVQTIISWKTDKPATSRVLFEEGVSTSAELAQSTPLQQNLVKDHIVVTTSFKPGKVYRFRIESIDGIGNISTSKDYTILTPRPEENVVDLIINNFEQSFGFLKKINF